MRTLTSVFKSLSDPTRLQMLGLLLEEGELCVCDFVEVLGITQSKASRHLRHLVNAGLLEDRREAMWVHFRVVDAPGPAQSAALRMLESVLVGRVPETLFARLADWRRRKGRGGPQRAGSAGAPRKARPGKRSTTRGARR